MEINIQEFLIYSSSFVDAISQLVRSTFQFLYSSIVSLIDTISQFVSASLLMTIFGTLAAAFAGSYGAQYSINKKQNKDALLSEIRNTNSAIMAAFNISNTCLSLKTQHVKSLKEGFESQKSELEQFKKGMKNGTTGLGKQFEFRANLQSLPPLSVPIDILEKQMFEKISARGRALGLTITLASTIQSLNRSINHRNTLIEWIKENVSMDEHGRLAQLYFGLPNNEGHIDSNYPDSIDSIYSLTDDCIFFSKLLCADLNSHGTKLKESLGDKLIVITEPNFEKAETIGLMPNEENYDDWKEMYKSK